MRFNPFRQPRPARRRWRLAVSVDALLKIEGVTRRFDGHPAVDDVTLPIRRGEFFVVHGCSGDVFQAQAAK